MGQRKRSRAEKTCAKLKRAAKRRRRLMRAHVDVARAIRGAEQHLIGF